MFTAIHEAKTLTYAVNDAKVVMVIQGLLDNAALQDLNNVSEWISQHF